MKKAFPLLLAVLAMAIAGCKKELKDTEPTPVTPDPPPVVQDYPMADVQVQQPNSSVDLSTCKLVSFGLATAIDAQGKSKAAYSPGKPTIGYVLDKDNRMLLAGFITDTTKVINTRSTANFLLYLGFKIPLRPYPLTPYFINHIHEVVGTAGWQAQFDSIYRANPLAIDQGAVVEPLRKKLEEMTQSTKLDIRKQKAADINVDDANVRSGIQVSSPTLSQFTITNTYRRRAHAFLYKKSFKNLNGIETNISNFDATGKDFKIDPTAGATSLLGEAGKVIEGKTYETAATSNGPNDLALEDNESEATYLLRIIGPGISISDAQKPKTQKETEKLNRLEIETFALDYLLPIIMELAGNKEALNKGPLKAGDGPTEKFLGQAEVFIKAFPDVYEEMKTGNYNQAARKAAMALWSNTGQKFLQEFTLLGADIMYSAAIESGAKAPKISAAKVQEMIGGLASLMKVFDLVLFSSDLVRITANITTSRQLEEWKLTARGANVSLTPEKSIVIPFQQQKVTAIIKNFIAPDGTHPLYEWKTTGKFGALTDTKGHNNQTSFSSQDAEVFYVSRSSSNSLGNGSNLDYIYVTAYYGSTPVGSDTIVIDVQKEKYKIKPDGITVSGKKGSTNEVTLYLEKAKGINTIEANDSTDYKVVWTTGGKYGNLSGDGTYNQRSVTQYDKNWIIYECTDDDIKEAVENITANIYSKFKSEPESAYRLIDDAKGTVKINNDEKKKIVVLPLIYEPIILVPSVGNWAVYPGVKIPLVDSTLRYSVRLFDITGTSTTHEGTVYAWEAGKRPPTPYNIYPQTNDIKGGIQFMVIGRTWCGGPCEESNTLRWIEGYKKLFGTTAKAEVTYFLK